MPPRATRPTPLNLAVALERLGRSREAEYWYRWVADTGDPDAACNLGLLLARTGRGNEALKHLGIAAGQGHVGAAYHAATVCEDTGDPEGARYWYEKAATLGHKDATRWLRRNLPGDGSGATATRRRTRSQAWRTIAALLTAAALGLQLAASPRNSVLTVLSIAAWLLAIQAIAGTWRRR